MSFQSWIDEFYPVDALTLAHTEGKTDEDLINHSILKWQGALPENLEKHKVCYYIHEIFDPIEDKDLTFDSDSCALCVKYDGFFCNTFPLPEDQCPIIRMTGNPCDSRGHNDNGVYDDSRFTPKPMIELLEKTLKFVKQEA